MQSITAKESASIKSKEIPLKHETVEPLASYFVSRIEKDYDDANTIIGGMFTATNRRLNEDHLLFLNKGAYSGGLDFMHHWKEKTYYISLKSVFSHVYGNPEAITLLQYESSRYFQRPDFDHLDIDSSRTSLTGMGSSIEIGKAGNGRWRYHFGINYQSPELELNDIGFLRTADLIEQEASLGYTVYEPFSIFRTLSVSLWQSNYWNFGGYYLFSRIRTSLNSQFANKWRTSLGINRNFEGLDTRSLRGGPALLKPGEWSPYLSIESDRSKKISFEFMLRSDISDDGLTKGLSYSPGISLRLGNSIELRSSLDYNLEQRNLQYVEQLEYNNEKRFIMAYLDRRTLGLTLRADYGITPDLTIQYYGSPYISTGQYSNFKRITNPRAELYNERFHTFTENEIVYDPNQTEYLIDESADGSVDYVIANPDFNFRQFRSNFVARWEYKQGSTLYLVWTHSKTGYDNITNPSIMENISELRDIYPTNVFLIKLNYWFTL